MRSVLKVLQLPLLLLVNFNSRLSHYRRFAPRNVTRELGLEGASKKFSKLAIAHHI